MTTLRYLNRGYLMAVAAPIKSAANAINNTRPPIRRINTRMDYQKLCDSMKNRTPMEFIDDGLRVHTGIVNTIQAEDGSGKSWNVTLHTNERLYLRTN